MQSALFRTQEVFTAKSTNILCFHQEKLPICLQVQNRVILLVVVSGNYLNGQLREDINFIAILIPLFT